MLPIPSSLLDKVKQAMQTIGNNAEPKMTIIAQKAAKFLTQGSFLNPRTVRTGNSLGPLDICIRRETRHQEPTEIVMAYIENGLAKVATLPYVHTPDIYFTYQYTIGPATDVACDFDGRWNMIEDRTGLYFDTETLWELITFGEPYIAIVNDGVLSVRQGQSEPTQLDIDAVKCSMHRGWKSTTDVLTEQGLICAYTKSDSKAYYRNYCEQEDGSYIWEASVEITDFGSPVDNISIFRAADYRTGFLAEVNGNILMMLTVRSWSGMATLPEKFRFVNASGSVERIEVVYADCYSDTDNIEIAVSGSAYRGYILSPVILDAYNYDDGEGNFGLWVRLKVDECLWNTTGNEAAFKITDAYNMSWYGQEIINQGRILLIRFGDFNNAEGLVTLSYTPGTVNGDQVAFEADSIVFMPTGLIPTYVPPPVALSAWNIDNKTIIIEFDRPIVSINSQSGFAVIGQEPNMSPEGTLQATTYGVSSVEMIYTTKIQINLTDVGRMKHPQGDVVVNFTGSLTGPQGAQVMPFSLQFTPQNLVIIFNPNDPERLTSIATGSVIRRKIVYSDFWAGIEYLEMIGASGSVTRYHINDIPT